MSTAEDLTGGELREGYAEIATSDCITWRPVRDR